MRTGETRVPAQVTVTLRGEVPQTAADYARDKVERVMGHTRDPILAAKVVLSLHPDPAHASPAEAEATLDVDGTLVRATAASADHFAAIDLVEAKLHRNLTEYDDKRRALHRRPAR